jgi:hypothetical protein
MTARESRRHPQPGMLRQVCVEGGKPGAVREVLADLKPIEGRSIAPQPPSTRYATFNPTAASPQPGRPLRPRQPQPRRPRPARPQQARMHPTQAY